MLGVGGALTAGTGEVWARPAQVCEERARAGCVATALPLPRPCGDSMAAMARI